MKQLNTFEERKLIAIIRLRIPAMAASAKEPVGPALGQYGIPITEFCSRFNDLSQTYIKDTIINATLFYYSDKQYDLFIQIPNSSYFIIKAASLQKGNRRPGRLLNLSPHVGYITFPMLFEILLYLQKYNASNFNVDRSNFKKMVHSINSLGFFSF